MLQIGYHFARAQAALMRRSYSGLLPRMPPLLIREQTLPFEVFSYSSEAMLPEQVASIRSFLRNAGRPIRWTVVSDGSHSQKSTRILSRLDPCITFEFNPPAPPADLPSKAKSYLSRHHTGKQLALIMSLPRKQPALYVDADVLFFAGAADLPNTSRVAGSPALYLLDCQLAGDERLLRSDKEALSPINTGVLFLFERIDFTPELERFIELKDGPTFFTNQTMTHLALHRTSAQPLDPKRYVLKLDDQFLYRDHYANHRLVLRHYVNPVRHKFWNSLSRS